MIMVQSTFKLVPETKDEALRLMKNMVRLCRQEHGCLSYEYFEGITDPNQIVLFQEWESADALQGHFETAHMEEFLGKLGRLLRAPVSTRSYVSQDEETVVASAADEASRDGERPADGPQTIH
ncbi:MAG: putative quinol monooxygenase [Gammaproteobacteria bacterium]